MLSNIPSSCASLESKYCAFLEERLHWRSLVSYMGNRKEPVLRWFRYKESFNSESARRVEFGLTREEFILNTFSGLGVVLYILHRMKASQANLYRNQGINNIWHPV